MGLSYDPLWAKEIFLEDRNSSDFTKDDSFIHSYVHFYSLITHLSIHPFDHVFIKKK